MSAGIAEPGGIAEPREPDASRQTLPPPRSLTFRHYNAAAAAAVLAASGTVCAEDFAFVVFSAGYLYFLSKVAFPLASPKPLPPVYGRDNKVLGLYIQFSAVIALFLPIAYILHGMIEGDADGVKAAAPHVFLLCSQIFMEGVSFIGGYALPVFVFVPVFYNSMRISSILEWIRIEFSREGLGFGGNPWRGYAGKGLAIINMAFWSFNLFGFLLPFFLPKAFKLYYSNVKD